MKTSEEIDQLATALSAAQAEMPAAVLNRINPHFKSQYADLASIREASLPSLTKNGLSIVQTTENTPDGFVLCSRLMHKSGQWIEGEWPITPGSPQSMGSQLTYFRRYLWSGQTGMTADDDDDANAAEASSAKVKSAHRLRKDEVYPPEEAEIRACTTTEELRRYQVLVGQRITDWPDTWKQHLRDEWTRKWTELEDGVTEEGGIIPRDKPLVKKLKASLAEEIDDQIPETGGGAAA